VTFHASANIRCDSRSPDRSTELIDRLVRWPADSCAHASTRKRSTGRAVRWIRRCRSPRRVTEENNQTGDFQGCGRQLAQDGHAWSPAGNVADLARDLDSHRPEFAVPLSCSVFVPSSGSADTFLRHSNSVSSHRVLVELSRGVSLRFCMRLLHGSAVPLLLPRDASARRDIA